MTRAPVFNWPALPCICLTSPPCATSSLPPAHRHILPPNSPAQALGMGVHESQSLLWERMVGLSRPFAAYLLPLMREHFPQASAVQKCWELGAHRHAGQIMSCLRGT